MPLIIKNYDPDYADNAPQKLGFDATLDNNVDYVEDITEIIGFRDNPLPNDYAEDVYTWSTEEEYIWVDNTSYEWSSYNLTGIAANINQFEIIAFQESLSNILPLSDSETETWDITVVSGDAYDLTKLWNKDWEYISDNLVDLGNNIYPIEITGFQDSIREWVSIIYEEWEITIWNYEETWNDEKVWVWEGKSTAIEITVSDSHAFDDLLGSNQDYIDILLENAVGFHDDIPYVLVAVWMWDEVGYDSSPEYLGITTEETLTDIIGLQETLVINYYNIIHRMTDAVGFQETLLPTMYYYNILIQNEVGFADRNYTKDHVVFWRTRTHNLKMAYGGMPYGEYGYGDGAYTDIKEYRVQVKNTSTGALIRDVIITVTDNTEATPNYVYSWAMNLADNITFLHTLTFDVYEVDTYGNMSEKRTVTAT